MSNQTNENQEQLFLEGQFRNVFFSKASSADPKHAHLQDTQASTASQVSVPSSATTAAVTSAAAVASVSASASAAAVAAAATKKKLRKNSLATRPPPVALTTSKATPKVAPKAPKLIRRFRSRSLPIISYRRPSTISFALGLQIGNGASSSVASTAAAAASAAAVAARRPESASATAVSASSSSNSTTASGTLATSLPTTSHHTSHGSGAGSTRSGHLQHHTSSSHPSQLPPINLQSLKEIDLHEILKNPQLRHDILFDPQLQFRPNLDGERGKRKKNIIDSYWTEIEKECHGIFVLKSFNIKASRIPSLFVTLRDILLSLLPYKDRAAVNDVMDMDLLLQQLAVGTFDFVSLANWLGKIFKCHCAPMRDNWVTEMVNKFSEANDEYSVEKLVCGLRMIFSILEAMKLDVANHQIRILRPVLIETAVEFEKDYFNQLISHRKLDINDLLRWYSRSFNKKITLIKTLFPQEIEAYQRSQSQDHSQEQTSKQIELFEEKKPSSNSSSSSSSSSSILRTFLTSSVLDLLSCRKMVNEFPSTLAFDHTRLILLRADIRQLVCIQLCVVLYKQLIFNNTSKLSPKEKAAALLSETINKVQEEILSIVTDDNGTIKWTRNVNAIALQLVKNTFGSANLNQNMIDFSYSWLIKQIQPNLEVYGLMEEKIFKELLIEIAGTLKSQNAFSNDATSLQATGGSGSSSTASLNGKKLPFTSLKANSNTSNAEASNTNNSTSTSTSEMKNIATRIATLVKFHWNVFGSYYTGNLNSQSHTSTTKRV